MNKQAVTFLSLFALILVLSMYYLLVESEPQENVSSLPVSQIETMQSVLDSTHENIIQQNNEIIASPSSSEEDVDQALNVISTTQTTIEKEKELLSLVKKAGYKKAYVEISGSIVKVVINKTGATSKDARQVIDIMSKEMGQIYQVEVKFIQD